MKTLHIVAIGLIWAAPFFAASCASPEDAQKAEEVKEAAEDTAQSLQESAGQAAKGLEEMAKGLGALTGGGGKTAEPVSFRELQTVLPEFDGWQKGKPTGERMSSPVSFSQAEVSYTNGDQRIQAKIIDSGFNQILVAPYAMFLTAGYEKETESGYEKSTKVAGYPGWEKWNEEGKDGELNALVGNRFVVTFEGNGINDISVLHDLAQKSDLAKLAAMK
jgi:hypothetical protein